MHLKILLFPYQELHLLIQMLADFLGNDLRKVGNELTKLKLVLGGNKVSADDVEKHIGISKEYNVFELQKALGTKDVSKASMIVNHFEANPKNNPIAMVATIANNAKHPQL